ncbi:hypothetical protein P171DRAFT_199224 [Karstenula rhodostoma CBS 690.94]|uniref:Uncharacterized protein n=1 Tax=Karstenula rhodostoma CBS 690.94 TaxID=1392251 RepID=A0A9P4UGM9_9PLEO|nr:hypothetical protein P171DRAFT_199224 [Karstenula rhodostoma CBS 690.94]
MIIYRPQRDLITQSEHRLGCRADEVNHERNSSGTDVDGLFIDSYRICSPVTTWDGTILVTCHQAGAGVRSYYHHFVAKRVSPNNRACIYAPNSSRFSVFVTNSVDLEHWQSSLPAGCLFLISQMQSSQPTRTGFARSSTLHTVPSRQTQAFNDIDL